MALFIGKTIKIQNCELMDADLRKRHKYNWLLLAVLLPILLIFIIKDLDFSNSSRHIVNNEVRSIPFVKVLKEKENELIKIELLQETKEKSFHLVIKKPIKSASTIGYLVYSENKKVKLPGKMDKVSGYVYSLGNEKLNFDAILGVILHDEIKGKEITKLEF